MGTCHPQPYELPPVSELAPALLLLAVSSIQALTPRSQTTNSQIPTIKTEANVVLVDVVVTQGKGEPVVGLHREDFQVSEDGRPQTISFFEEHTGGTVSPVGLPPMPPDVFTNYPTIKTTDSINVLSAGDLETDLKRLKRDIDSGNPSVPVAAATPLPSSPLHAGWRKWGALTALLFLAALLALWLRAPPPPPRITGSRQITSDGLPKLTLVTDGSRIFFTENPPSHFSVTQVSAGGGDNAPLDVPIDNPVIADISPEGSQLLLTQPRFDGGDSPYWVMPVPAGSPGRLGEVAGHDATWTPEGKLVFARGNDLYIAEHDGSNPRKFASAPALPSGIAFSPDGTRFRFTASRDNAAAIWEARADGTGTHRLFPAGDNSPADCCGSWTPDGKYYVFQSYRDRASNIWIVAERSEWWRNVSHEPIQLTTGPLQFSNPLLSRDGKKLFVIGKQRRAELVRYDAKSGNFVPYLGGISAGRCGVLPRWAVGHLCQLSRLHAVAQQGRRKRSASAYLPAPCTRPWRTGPPTDSRSLSRDLPSANRGRSI